MNKYTKKILVAIFLPLLFLTFAGSGYLYCKVTTSPRRSTFSFPLPSTSSHVLLDRKPSISSLSFTTKNDSIKALITQPQTFFIVPSKGKMGVVYANRGWTQTTKPMTAAFIWVQNKQVLKNLYPWNKVRQDQIVNHLEFERELGHKGRLLHYLHTEYGLTGFQYMQPSWRLWIPKERAHFLMQVKKKSLNGMLMPFTPFITKKAHLDNGAGIDIISSPNKLQKLVQDIERSKASAHKNFIVQQYLTHPLLTEDKKKFDLRIYFLIVSVNPLVVLYYDGYMRVALDVYNENINNLTKRGHLTNAKVQKDHNMKLYLRQKETTRREFQELSKMLKKTTIVELQCKIKKALVAIIKAARAPIKRGIKNCPLCFSLLGADFMVDQAEENVWISEVQSGPGLPTNTRTTKKFFRRLLPNVADILEEVADLRRKQKNDLWPLTKIGDFHLIYHESSSSFDVMNECVSR